MKVGSAALFPIASANPLLIVDMVFVNRLEERSPVDARDVDMRYAFSIE